MALRILRRPEVEHRTGLNRSAIYQLIAEGDFPRQIKIGRRASGWDEREINAWIERRIAASRGGHAA